MDVKKKNALIAASVAGILAVAAPAMISSAYAQDAAAAKVPCYGVNACKGTGDCGGKGHSCAGKNACKGAGFKFVGSAEECLKQEGGRLTAEKE